MNTPAPLDLPSLEMPQTPVIVEETGSDEAVRHTDGEQSVLNTFLQDASDTSDAITPSTWEANHDLVFRIWEQFADSRFESGVGSGRASKSRLQPDQVQALKASADGNSDWANLAAPINSNNSVDGTQQGKFDLYASMMDEVGQAFGIEENTNASSCADETHQDAEIELPPVVLSVYQEPDDQVPISNQDPEFAASIFSLAAAAEPLDDDSELDGDEDSNDVNVMPCDPVVFQTPDGQLRFDDTTGMMDLGHASSYQHDSWCLTGQMTFHDVTQVYHFQLATAATVKPVMLVSVWTGESDNVTPVVTVLHCDGQPLPVDILYQQDGTQTVQVRDLEPNSTYWLSVRTTEFASQKPATVWMAFDFREQAAHYQNLATGVLWETQELSAHNLDVTHPCLFGFDLSAISPTNQYSTVSLGIIDSVGNVVFSLCTSLDQPTRGAVLLDTGHYVVRLMATPAAINATLDHLAINLQYQPLPNPTMSSVEDLHVTPPPASRYVTQPGYMLTPLLATDPLTWCEHVANS